MTEVENVLPERDNMNGKQSCHVHETIPSTSTSSQNPIDLLNGKLNGGDEIKEQQCKYFGFDVGGNANDQISTDHVESNADKQSLNKNNCNGFHDLKTAATQHEGPESLKHKERSVFSYFYSELTRGYWLEHDEARYSEKREKMYTFMKIPRELEKFMVFAFFYCLDAFLYVFTFLPLRFTMGLLKLGFKVFLSVWKYKVLQSEEILGEDELFYFVTNNISQRRFAEAAQICDLLKGIILITCCCLMQYVDISMMYHLIRGQAIIKLYLFFNMLEVADRLFASFGQDVLDSLFWTATEPRDRKREHFGVIPHFTLAVFYVFGHSVLMLFQATTLNVAFNSHNKALLTIMMSNNFLEIKSYVFKKFGKNNLFHLSCYDVRERFHFVILLGVVCMRNLTEFSWSMAHMWVLLPDILMIFGCEFMVDWVKHAFITKFNEIPDDVYQDYTRTLAIDMMTVRTTKSHSDQLDLLSRRMGFTPLPLAVILIRVVSEFVSIDTYKMVALVGLFYICLVSLKVLNSIVLLGKACSIVDSKHKSSYNSMSEDEPTKQKTTEPDRRRSDPCIDSKYTGIQEVAPTSIKRSYSVSGKMNVTFSDTEVRNTCSTPVIIDNNLQNTTLSPKILFDNSTVSLQSIGLVNDEDNTQTDNNTIHTIKTDRVESLLENSELKHRNLSKTSQ